MQKTHTRAIQVGEQDASICGRNFLSAERETIMVRDLLKAGLIEAWPANVRLDAPYQYSYGVHSGLTRTVIRVTTEDGVIGLGETPQAYDAGILNSAPDRVIEAMNNWAPVLGSADYWRWEHSEDATLQRACAGIEMALWDATAKSQGVPLYDLLGGASRLELPCTEYFAPRIGRESRVEEIAEYCTRMALDHGSLSFEGKVGVFAPDEDIRLITAVREAVGDEKMIRIDANMGWSVETAAYVLDRMASLDIANVEEPVGSFEEMVELRKLSSVPFSTHNVDVRSAVKYGVPDSICCDPATCGGIGGMADFIDHCEKLGVGIWGYSGDLGIAGAAMLHVLAARPYANQPSQSLLRWYADDVIVGGPFAFENGYVSVPSGNGLGVELDEDALGRAVELYEQEGDYDRVDHYPPLPRF